MRRKHQDWQRKQERRKRNDRERAKVQARSRQARDEDGQMVPCYSCTSRDRYLLELNNDGAQVVTQ